MATPKANRQLTRGLLLAWLIFMLHSTVLAWGPTGHRIVGEIAWLHLNKRARAEVQRILGNESLAMSSNWMDFIKSDTTLKHMDPWHYATIPDGEAYATPENVRDGLIIDKIRQFQSELATRSYTDGDELFTLRCLVHLVGDIHQPLHVGRGTDLGGNMLKVTWFDKVTNLHAVWDSDIIENQKLSYTEYVTHLNHATAEQIALWQSREVLDWAYESMSYRELIYDLPENKVLKWNYIYQTIDVVELRLLQGGIRLAGVLNSTLGVKR